MPKKKATRRRKKLPLKRQRFVEALLGPAMGNQTQAARIAGYAVPGQEGHRLLKFADVSDEVARRREAMCQAMGSDEIIARLSGMARADMSQFFELVDVAEEPELGGDKLEAARKAEVEARGEKYEPPPPKTYRVARFDIARAIDAGYGWLINGYSSAKDGPRVTIESPKAALDSLAKIRGLVKQNVPPPTPFNFNLTLALKDMPEAVVEHLVSAMARQHAQLAEGKPTE